MNPNQTGGGGAKPFTYASAGQTETPKPMKLGSNGSSNSAKAFSYTSRKTDLKTTEGLYELAQQTGLGKEADKMIQRSGGESQKFMSGGFVMDAMDILNIGSYGMVGLVKGKGFIEGVKNRETLSDDDALGKYGWQGKVAGFIGDIVLDPLTYIAPVKIVSKIPGVAKTFSAATEKVFGKLVTREVGGEVAEARIKKIGLTDSSDYIYQGVGEGKESDFLTTSIGEANTYATQRGLKGSGEIRVYKYSDLPDDLVTITKDDEYYDNVVEKFGNEFVDRRLSKEEYSRFRSAIGFRKEEISRLNKVGSISPDKTGLDTDSLLSKLDALSPKAQMAVSKAASEAKSIGELETILVPGQKTFKREGGFKPMVFLANKLVYGYAASKEFLGGVQKIAGRNEAILGDSEKLFSSISKINPKTFDMTLSVGSDGRMLSKPLSELEVSMKRDGLDKEFELVKEMYTLRDTLMDRLVNLGVLTKETKDAHWGTYLKQSYDEFLEAKDAFGGSKSNVGINSKKRVEDLTPEKMEELGQVKDGSVLWATTILKQVDLVKKAEIQKFTADGYAMTAKMLEEYGKKGGLMEDLHQIPVDPKRYGPLSGKFVSKEVWSTLKGSFEPSKEIGENFVLGFKHLKVVWNPASHVRNAFSATIQNWWKLGMGPWRVDLYYEAQKEFRKGSKHLQEMREMGFSERSGYLSELMNNYLTNDKLVKKTIEAQLGKTGSFRKYARKLDRVMMNSYGHTDNIAKLAAYKYGLKKGLKKEDAYAQAMAATFNYSEITPFVHQMRRAIWGVPFITFALKAVPLTAEVLAKSPGKVSVFGKARNTLFQAAGVEGDQEAEALPDYMRDDMFVMRLPWKDSNGRSMYFDLSYIIPFGALADGTFFKEPMSLNPVVQLVRELSRNETFGGKKIFRESDDVEDVITDISIHVMKLGLPPPVTDFISEGYNNEGVKVPSKIGWERAAGININDFGAGERTHYQNAFRMLGVGAVPYELNSKESALAYTQRENLTKLLTDNGIIKTFNAPYLPQDSELRPENQGFGPAPIYDRDTRPIGR